jgi:adenine-specific DNA-methyltransferase
MDKLKMQTTNVVDENIKRIGELFPNCLTERLNVEGKPEVAIDFDQLRQELSKDIVEGTEERYQFTWPDKRNAIRLTNAPTTDTLRPCREESVDFDNTQNLYIEGDNLQVLKLLREDYLGKVKMIYIDPPYNTGNDFVYNDDFAQSADEYIHNSGQLDEEGNRLVANTESNGRFHTDWLNMIYPRLKVAKDLLSEDGVIFISIDDREAENLIKVCNEIYGESCFVANISWQKTYSPRNDSKGIPAEKECIIIFGRKPGWAPKKLPRTTETDSKYKNPDKDPKGEWTSSDAAAPGAKTHQGMVYAIQHPLTGEYIYPANNRCWAYDQKEMLRIMNGWMPYELKNIDDSKRRAVICGVSTNDIKRDVKAIVAVDFEANWNIAQEVFKSAPWPKLYFTGNDGKGGIRRKTYLADVDGLMVTNLWPHTEVGHTDEAKKELKALFDGDIPFDTPKPVRLLNRIVQIATDEDSIVLDFFSGSATTAHAVMQHNASDSAHRKFILVQIPENVDNKYGNLCEIGKERIRRAGKKIKGELQAKCDKLSDEIASLIAESKLATQLSLMDDDKDPKEELLRQKQEELKKLQTQLDNFDTGFRVLKLDTSNMEDVYYTPEEFTDKTLFDNNIKLDRTDEDLLFQSMIELGIELSTKIVKTEIAGKTVWNVSDGYLLACFDKEVNETTITEVAKLKPSYFIMRDSSLANDNVADNFEQIFEHYSKDTIRRIL